MKYHIGDYVAFKNVNNTALLGKIVDYKDDIKMYYVLHDNDFVRAVAPYEITHLYWRDGFVLQESVKDILEQIKNPFFQYYHYKLSDDKLPDNVFFNDKKKATTLMFGKEATVVKCGKDDEYSRRIGFLEAYFQATCGLSKTKAKKYLENIVKDKEEKK